MGCFHQGRWLADERLTADAVPTVRLLEGRLRRSVMDMDIRETELRGAPVHLVEAVKQPDVLVDRGRVVGTPLPESSSMRKKGWPSSSARGS